MEDQIQTNFSISLNNPSNKKLVVVQFNTFHEMEVFLDRFGTRSSTHGLSSGPSENSDSVDEYLDGALKNLGIIGPYDAPSFRIAMDVIEKGLSKDGKPCYH